MTSYKEDHNDDTSPYDDMVSDHERRSLHDPKEAKDYCQTCVVIFNYLVEDGKICRFHPTSYFEQKTATKESYCQGCETEETI
jgi:hypothetical protein